MRKKGVEKPLLPFKCERRAVAEVISVDLDQYQQLTRRTVPDNVGGDSLLVMAALGCTGEAGELADLVKKELFQGRERDHGRLIEELGDLLWYVSKMADALGITLSCVAEENIRKLTIRYPNGFSVEDGIAKRDRERECGG